MQSDPQRLHRSQPRAFNYSLDWRFLLPISDAGKLLVLGEGTDFTETLEQVGIPVSNLLSFSEIKQNEKNDYQSLVIPFGLPIRRVGAHQHDQIEFYRSIRRLIQPGGYLLVGFRNSWNFRSNAQSEYHSSTPRRVVDQLHQAGFNSIKMFGAIPNLSIPEYIFDLQSQAMRFVLYHFFRRKPPMLTILQWLSRTTGLASISAFLPCYFAVAKA